MGLGGVAALASWGKRTIPNLDQPSEFDTHSNSQATQSHTGSLGSFFFNPTTFILPIVLVPKTLRWKRSPDSFPTPPFVLPCLLNQHLLKLLLVVPSQSRQEALHTSPCSRGILTQIWPSNSSDVSSGGSQWVGCPWDCFCSWGLCPDRGLRPTFCRASSAPPYSETSLVPHPAWFCYWYSIC